MFVLGDITKAQISFDELTSGLTILNTSGSAGVYYESGCTPDDGHTPNAMLINSGDSATASIITVPGKKYIITVRRRVDDTSNMSFYLDINGVRYMHDWSYDSVNKNTYQEASYLGYYLADSSGAIVKIYNGGTLSAHIDWIRFDDCNDVYFDEKTPGINYFGTAGPYTFSVPAYYNSSLSDSGPNGMYLNTVAHITGYVPLVPGRIYNVFASRQVLTNGNLSYDLSLDGKFFVHDGSVAPTAPYNSTILEKLLGQFTAHNWQTSISVYNAGAWNAAVDYIRFKDAGIKFQSEDFDQNYYVDFADFVIFAENWFKCTDPANPNCF